MKNKSLIKYSILILALILSSLRIHPCLNILSIYLTCLFISINLNAKKMFEYSIFIFTVSIILKVVLNVNSHYFKEDFYENLENQNDDNKKEDNKKEDNKKEKKEDGKGGDDEGGGDGKGGDDGGGDDDGGDGKGGDDDGGDDDGGDGKGGDGKGGDDGDDTRKNKDYTITKPASRNNLTTHEIEGLDFVESMETKEDKELFKGSDLNLITPAQAQRELYRLVDTTSLLTKTMNELSPILNEGKNIMNTLEQLNITSKLAK
jgi:hypothetical protein